MVQGQSTESVNILIRDLKQNHCVHLAIILSSKCVWNSCYSILVAARASHSHTNSGSVCSHFDRNFQVLLAS